MGIDHRTDVFSLGVVLYELLTLRRPFEGDTSHQVAAQIVTKDPPDVRTIRSRVPRDLAVIAGKALEKDRDKRFQSMGELAADLRRHLANEPILAKPPTAVDRLVKWTKRHPAKTASAAIVAVTFTVIAALLVVNVRTNKALEAKSSQLQEKTTESEGRRVAAEEAVQRERLAAEEAVAARDDVLRLSALQRLEELIEEADRLWPAHPENIERYEKWLERAGALVTELPDHERRLAELRESTRPWSGILAANLPVHVQQKLEFREVHPRSKEITGLERRITWCESYLATLHAAIETGLEPEEIEEAEDEIERVEERLSESEAELAAIGRELTRPEWAFEDNQNKWWHNQLEKLVNGIHAFADEETGLFSEGTSEEHGWGVNRRLSSAVSLRDGFAPEGNQAQAWARALPEIRAAYPGLALTPQLGLVPIGPDPESKLWEFAHLETGEPAVRGADGKLVVTEETGLVFVLLPGGTFQMGAQSMDPTKPNYDPQARDDEGPVHEVTLSAFFLSKYEMTQGQWERFVGKNPSNFKPGNFAKSLVNPVEQVSWLDCMEVMGRLGLSLPSEAQWEYGARGRTTTAWWTGSERETLRGAANLADHSADWPERDDGYLGHAPVNEFRPNAFGLHNAHGNVWEWCLDGYDDNFYGKAATKDPVSLPEGSFYRGFRGGSLGNAAVHARSADRYSAMPSFALSDLGLRPARAIAP